MSASASLSKTSFLYKKQLLAITMLLSALLLRSTTPAITTDTAYVLQND